MRRDELRLHDILEHIESALLAVAGKVRSDFDADPMLQKAVQYDLLTIGEATTNISEELRTKYSAGSMERNLWNSDDSRPSIFFYRSRHRVADGIE